MKRLRDVVWTQGMFLTPQHFQTHARCVEDSLQFRFTASCFANWGVTNLQIDHEGLANGVLSLLNCRGLLPDGLPFDMPGTDSLPPSRDIGAHFLAKEDSLDVFLALPNQPPRGKNVTLVAASSDVAAAEPRTRYVAEAVAVPDETGHVEERTVQIARRNFRLLFGGESLDGFTTLRLTQVVRDSQGAYILNPRFVAPCLDISSSEFLMNLLRRQIEVLATKGSSLSGLRREKGKGEADFTSSELADYWLLHTLNSHLPVLDHIWSVRHGHPEVLFVALLQLAGALSTFSLQDDPRNLPKYDHDDLGACFTALDQRVRSMLDVARDRRRFSIPLELSGKHIWTGSVPDDYLFEDSQFFLSVAAELAVEDLIQEVLRRVKIAAPDDIQIVIQRALPGVKLRHEPTPPSAIGFKLNTQYFGISQHGHLWDKVRSSRNIALFVPQEIEKPKLEILVILP